MTEQARTNGAGAVGGLVKDLPTDRLLQETRDLLTALGERALDRVGTKLGDATDKLSDYAENGGGGPGLAGALAGGRSLAEGRSAVRSALDTGLAQAKEKTRQTAKNLLGGRDGKGGGRGRKLKVTNIVESIEVGVPVSVAYNQWTQFQDFPGFMKKVERVEQESETELDWKAQIFLSHRTWKSTVTEQVPDERIVWRSEGEKGRVDGAVTFHEVTPDLTKILLVLQYHPQGLFEHTGNLWRAQGRRARLELKHFQRHVMTETILHQDEVRGWRGEVLDGEVVRGDEEVREEEAQDQDTEDRADTGTDTGTEDAEAEAADTDTDTEDDEAADTDTEDDEYDQNDGDDQDDEQADSGR
jgi:uncharacterized membrane protein